MRVAISQYLQNFKCNYFKFFFVFIIVVFVMSNIEALFKLYSISLPLTNMSLVFKFMRDFCIFSLLLFLHVFGVSKRYLYLNAVFILGLMLSAINSKNYNLIWGLRFLLPLFFLITPYKKSVHLINLDIVKKILTVLLILHTSMQVFHLFFGSGYFAMIDVLGINARNPGIMFFPAAAAFLTLALFVICFCIDSKIKYIELYCISIFLCSSITGVVTFLILILILYKYLNKNQKIMMPVYFIITFISLHLARYAMTGASYLNETAGGRAKIFSDSFRHAKLSFSNSDFGAFTNGSVGRFGGGAVDSLYAALFFNLSFLWCIVLIVLFLFYLYIQREFFKNTKAQLIVILFLLTSAGMIITEVTFPFMLLVLAKIISVQYDEKA